jgi:hypothetical protein
VVAVVADITIADHTALQVDKVKVVAKLLTTVLPAVVQFLAATVVQTQAAAAALTRVTADPES